MEHKGHAEYLCTLQPRARSGLDRGILARRIACQLAGFRPDATGLFPPHISVTGFFTGTKEQALSVCALAKAELAARSGRGDQGANRGREEDGAPNNADLSVIVQRVVATDTGHVILDVLAPTFTELAAALAAQSADIGVLLRPKSVRHLSLASGRGPEEQAKIASIYADLPLNDCCWDLVISQLVVRSDLAKLQEGGEAHVFSELMRLPLPAAKGKGAAVESPAALATRGTLGPHSVEAVALGVATPMKKRPYAAGSAGRTAAEQGPDCLAAVWWLSKRCG